MEIFREIFSGFMKKNPVIPSSCPVPIPSWSHIQDKMGAITPSQTLPHLYPPVFPPLSLFSLNAALLPWLFQMLKGTHQTYIPARLQSIWDQGVIYILQVFLSQTGHSCLEQFPLTQHRELWLGCNFHDMILRSSAPGRVLWGLLDVSAQPLRPGPLEWPVL